MDPVAWPSGVAAGRAIGSTAVLPRWSEGRGSGGRSRSPARGVITRDGRAGSAGFTASRAIGSGSGAIARGDGLSVRAGREAWLPAGLPTAATVDTRLTTCTFGRSQTPRNANPASAAMTITWPSTDSASALTGTGGGAGAAATRQRVLPRGEGMGYPRATVNALMTPGRAP